MKDLYEVKKSTISSFVAEVFMEELKFILGDNNKDFFIKKEGVNQRSFSQDVVELSNHVYTDTENDEIKELIFVHISRNSLYHQLPEVFFHPLSIGSSDKSNREIVAAVKENRKNEKDNINFFIPFDSEIFKHKQELTNRFLHLYTNKDARNNMFAIAKRIIQKPLSLDKDQLYLLLLHLCNAEQLKENLSKISEVIKSIMGYTVGLKYKRKIIGDSPFLELGHGVIGYDFGLHGKVVSEQDDVIATIDLEEQLDYTELKRCITLVKEILTFFIFSNREVQVQYRFLGNNFLSLGNCCLGYDTVIVNN